MAELAPSHELPTDWPFLEDESSCRFFEVLVRPTIKMVERHLQTFHHQV
jgi:hypothetical protein